MMKNIVIGIAGVRGSFSEEAANLFLQNNKMEADFNYLLDMEGLLFAIHKKTIDLGILPVVNLIGGLVEPSFASMGKYRFQYVDHLWLTINQCLMTKKNINPTKIESVISYPQALKQCEKYLKVNLPHAKIIHWSDTAKSAEDLANGTFPENSAVIGCENAAKIYNLKIIAHKIQDSDPNLTAFIIIKPRGGDDEK